MAVTKQFTQLDPINNGTTAADNFKLSDVIPAQHTDLTGGVNKLVHRTLAQSLCEPVAVCNSNNPQNGAYVATCSNYPDFALSYQDAQQNTQYLIGLKIRVIFTYGITYGSVSGGTYPTLNINGSGAIPMLAQGKTMATGSASAEQTLEFTVIPYGNGIAFDADSNVRESTSDYTIYTDGSKVLSEDKIDSIISGANIASSVFTVTANWIANHTTDIRKLGIFLICNIFVQVTTAQTLSSASKIAELSIKPQNNIRVLGAVESTGTVIKAEINPQGEVTVSPYTGSVNVSGYIRFESIIFPTAS